MGTEVKRKLMIHKSNDESYDKKNQKQTEEDAALHVEMQEALRVLASDNEAMKQQLKQAVVMLASVDNADFEQLEQTAEIMAGLDS